MSLAPEDKYRVSYTFRGATISLLQTPRDRVYGVADAPDNTGWAIWEASNVLMRWLSADANVRAALRSPRAPAWGELRVLDVSAGAGLVPLAAAAAGAAAVTASDIPEQLQQLTLNIARGGWCVGTAGCNGAAGGEADGVESGGDGCALHHNVRVAPYLWGGDIEPLRPPVASAGGARWFDLALLSDILYIAIRDKREAELAHTIRALAPHCGALIMSLEERLPDEEQAFMERLGLAPPAARERSGGAPEAPPDEGEGKLEVEELTGDAVHIEFEDSLKGAGGHADTDIFSPFLWWTPPPIRMWVIRAREGRDVDARLGS